MLCMYHLHKKMIEGANNIILTFLSVTSIIFLDNFSSYFNFILQVLSYSKSKFIFLFPIQNKVIHSSLNLIPNVGHPSSITLTQNDLSHQQVLHTNH